MGNGSTIVKRNLAPALVLATLICMAVTSGIVGQRLSAGPIQGALKPVPVVAAPLQCPYDGYEPNDSFGEAYAIEPDISYYGAYICPSGDVDWFKFSVTSGEEIVLEIYNLPADFDLHLYDASNTHVATSANGGTAAEQIVHTAAMSGDYRAYVFGYAGASSEYEYTVRVELSEPPSPTPTSTPSCPGDDYESNNTFGAAYAIEDGVQYTAYVCPSGDEDWFRFSVAAGQEITVDLYGIYGDLPADFDLYLYDPSASQVDGSAAGGGAQEQIVHIAEQTGNYRVQVIGYAGAFSATPYRLMVTLGEEPTPTHTPTPTPTSTPSCPIDSYEPNDSFFEAYAIVPDLSYYAIYICPSGDEDWFKFSVNSGEEITADLYNLPADFDLHLFDPSGTHVGWSTHSGTTDEQIVYTAATTGDYRVAIFGYEGAYSDASDCTLRVELDGEATPTHTPTATPTATPTQHPRCPETESDDDFGSANSLTVGTTYTDYVCDSEDEDFYSFWLDTGDTITVDLFDMESDYALALYDHAGLPEVDLSDKAGAADEQIIYTALQDGTHYVKVFSGYGDYSTVYPYKLRVQMGAQEPTPTFTPTPTPTATPGYPGCNDYFEFNETCGGPAWSLTQSGWWSYVCTPSDKDYWKIPGVSISQTVQVSLTNLPKDYSLALYRPDCNPAAASNTLGTADEGIQFTADAGGTWYALVEGAGGAYDPTNPYLISGVVTDPQPPDVCQPDDMEPNDTPQQAGLWAYPHTTFITTGLSICPNDVDWYSVSLGAQDTLRANIGFRHAEGDLTMQLIYNDDPIRTADSATDNEEIVYESSYDDYYFIKVYHATAGGENRNYDLALQVMAPTPTASPTSTSTPTPTPTPTVTPTPHVCPPGDTRVDIELRDMEITQSIQDLDNSVPLVGFKTTVVRLYATGGVRQYLDRPLTGYLTATKGGVPLVPSQTACYGRQRTVDILTNYSKLPLPGRSSSWLGLYCVLPATWRQPGQQIKITGHVDVPQGYCDPYLADNEKELTATFGATQTLTIRAVQVREGCDRPSCGPLYNDYKDLHRLTARMYPVHKVVLIPHRGTSVTWDGSNGTLNKLLAMRTKDPAARAGNDYVLVGYKKTSDWFTAGAALPGRAWVRTNAPDKHQEDLAHELGHATGGLGHVKGCLFPSAPFEDYPYPGGDLSPGGDRDYWGLDTGSSPPYVRDPSTHGDVMSYCRPKWISDYTYLLLRDRLTWGGTSSVKAMALDSELEYLLAVGQINAETDEVSLPPMFKLPGSALNPLPDSQPGDPYAAQLLDGSETVLVERTFSLAHGSDSAPEEDAGFAVLVPYDPAAARFAITHEGAEIYSLAVSAHAPSVTLDPVTGTVTDTLTVSWTAEDLDDDALSAEVYLSGDGGETWELMTSDVEKQQVELDTSFWAETGEGQIRVLVTDGLNTGEGVTGPFTVTAKAPVVFAIEPEDGSTVPPGIPVLFTSTGYDAEDGPVEGDAVSWSSDRDGALGTGDQLLVAELSPGWHEITVAATDDDDNTGTDTIGLYVGYRTYLPTLLRASDLSGSSLSGLGRKSGRPSPITVAGLLLASFGVLAYLGGRERWYESIKTWVL